MADAFETGAGVDFPHRKRLGLIPTGEPVDANTLGDPNKVLSHYPVIPGGKESLQVGDIVAFPNPGGHGHVAIYVGNNEIIQAGENGVVVTFFTTSRPFVIRRYTP